MLIENAEAWEVLQRYTNPWGIDSGTILALCKVCKVKDPVETLDKVLTILSELEKSNA